MPYRTLEEYNDKYKDQTAYVVGSGPSLYNQNLDLIKNGITIAVNSGYLACPKANFFVTDDPGVLYWSYFRKDLVNNKETTPLLYADKLGNGNLVLGKRIVWYRHRTGYNLTTTYVDAQYENHIWQARSSIGTAIHIAYIMGCRKIVLLGIDCCYMHGNRYFWQFYKNKPTNLDRRVLKIHKPKEYNIDGKDILADPDLMEILKYWRSVSNEVKSKCEIVNASFNSVLDVFDKVDFLDVIRS